MLLFIPYLYLICSTILAIYTIQWHKQHPSTTGSDWPMVHDVMMSYIWPIVWLWRKLS